MFLFGEFGKKEAEGVHPGHGCSSYPKLALVLAQGVIPPSKGAIHSTAQASFCASDRLRIPANENTRSDSYQTQGNTLHLTILLK